jgi:hypothetical protein
MGNLLSLNPKIHSFSADSKEFGSFLHVERRLKICVLSLPITPSEVKSPLRAVRKRPERAVPDIFLRVG